MTQRNYGTKHYKRGDINHGNPCIRCGSPERYISNKKCAPCHRLRMEQRRKGITKPSLPNEKERYTALVPEEVIAHKFRELRGQ